MNDRLIDFLTQLGTDSDKLTQFYVEPEKAMCEAGLSEDDARHVLAGDSDALDAWIRRGESR
jgi:hypothetical protein